MRKPTTAKGARAVEDEIVPPGGRALERVKQDRVARGLPGPPPPGKLRTTDTAPAAKSGAPASRKKTGKRR